MTIALLLIWVSVVQLANGLKPGSSFELECPSNQTYKLGNVRTYALALISAHYNLEIDLTYKVKNSLEAKTCCLSKNNQLCLLDDFIQEFSLTCSLDGSASLLIL